MQSLSNRFMGASLLLIFFYFLYFLKKIKEIRILSLKIEKQLLNNVNFITSKIIKTKLKTKTSHCFLFTADFSSPKAKYVTYTQD